MKIKDKLAREYAKTRFENGSFTDQEEAFVAGFEAARRLANDQIKSVLIDTDVVFHKGEPLKLNVLELGETDET